MEQEKKNLAINTDDSKKRQEQVKKILVIVTEFLDEEKGKSLLSQAFSLLTMNDISQIMERLSVDAGLLAYFCERNQEYNVNNREKNVQTLLVGETDWTGYLKKKDRSFKDLIEEYTTEYLKEQRRKGKKVTRLELENIVSNHSKWHRMLSDSGIGKQYRDDLRRICLLYKLTYPQAVELLWMAGHPFDTDDPRDYEVAVCIATKVYQPEAVDSILEKKRLEKLFDL